MNDDWVQLSQYRLVKAKEDLNSAVVEFENGFIRGSINRSYYAIFHAIRAVLAIDFFDAKKHSGVLSYFQKNYIRTGLFSTQHSHIIETAFRIRNKSDYDDFYIVNRDEALDQIENAKILINAIEEYLQERFKKEREEK